MVTRFCEWCNFEEFVKAKVDGHYLETICAKCGSDSPVLINHVGLNNLLNENSALREELHRARTDSRYWDEFNTISRNDTIRNENDQLRERLARLVEAAKMAIPCLKDWIQSTGFGSINKRDKAALVAIEQAIDPAALSGNTVELKSLQAAAENILFKRKQNATLTDADFEWLKRAVNGE